MKILKLATLSVLTSLSLYAQVDHKVQQTTNDVNKVLNHTGSDQLNQQLGPNFCPEDEVVVDKKNCEGLANSMAPKGSDGKEWKTLFEVKYQPTDPRKRNSIASSNYRPYNFSYYRSNTGDQVTDLKTAADLDAETQQIKDWYKTKYGMDVDPHDIRTQLIIDQLTNPAYTKNDADMMNKIKAYSATMNDQEFLRFASTIGGYVDYNDSRAAFEQTEEGGLGIVTPFQQMMNTKAGVCGDVHSMVAKIGEQRGWEAFTVGYALEGMQHVVTAMVNPKDPDKLMIVNYGRYEETALNDGNSVVPAPTIPGWEEIGTQMRIFKNDKTGDPLGKMQQIATVPTALGSFMNDLFKREYEISKAMPNNENYRMEKATFQTTKDVTKLKQDGDKIKNKEITNGVMVYEGATDNAQIYGLAVSHDVFNEIYKWDENKKECRFKKNKYFSLGVAGSMINLPQAEFDKTFYLYLNIKGGQKIPIYQNETTKVGGIIGYEFEGFVAGYDQGFLTGDASFATLLGVVADYNKKGTSVHLGLTYETSIAMRNQNLMTDFSSLPTNLNPFAFNAVKLDANFKQQLSPSTSLVSYNNVTMTRVGGRVMFSGGIQHNQTSVMAGYQGGVKPVGMRNSLQSVNLLQNINNMDGFTLTVSQGFQNKKGTFSGKASGYVGASTSTVTVMPMFGGSLILNLNGKSKRKPATGN